MLGNTNPLARGRSGIRLIFLFSSLLVLLPILASSQSRVTALGSTSLSLNGTSQHATLGTSTDLRTAQFTIELWFQRTGAGLGTSTGGGGVTAIPLITKGRAEAETPAADVNYFLGINTATNTLAADFEAAAWQLVITRCLA